MSKDELNNKEVLDKEIDLIQGCINRMAQNSFMVKGWMISLVAVIIALLPEKVDVDVRVLCVIAFAVTMCFWYLDAFFLKIEKLYRRKYDWVIANRLQTLEYAYDLNPHNKSTWLDGNKEISIKSVMWSDTLRPMYFLLIGVEAFVYLNACHDWL